MGEDITKLKKSIASISRVLGKKAASSTPKPKTSPTSAKPITK